MAKTQSRLAVEQKQQDSGLIFEQAKVHFLYAFYLSGWRRLVRDFSESRLWVDTWGKNAEHCQLAWIAKQLGRRNESLLSVNVEVADDSGTRPFLRRVDPFIEIKLAAERLLPQNWQVMPELAEALGGQPIKVTPVVRLYYSGFGITCLKLNFLTVKGRELAIREIVHTADDSASPPLVPREAERVITELSGLLSDRSQDPPQAALLNSLEGLGDPRKRSCIAERTVALVMQQTEVLQPLTSTSVIQISNLDRGTGPLHKPEFRWEGKKGKYAEPLYAYFVHVINDLVAKPVSNGLGRAGFNLSEPLVLADQWHAEGGQHPYVSTFLPQYGNPGDGSDHAAVAATFRDRVEANQEEWAKMLLRTSWTHVRKDWAPISGALENLFYSDLVHINVHLRSTLCHYYLPTSAEGFEMMPELRNSYKYREELSKILGSQRILWYAYSMFDDEASQSMKDFTRQFDQLMACCIEEEDFMNMVNGLREVVQGIDGFKAAVAEIMIDPQSRKGGSSLFTEILDRTTGSFHLPELYANLRDKLDRLDMLGVHVTQTLQQCSQLRVAEGSRSTQFTLEFLEAIILAFYLTEMIHSLELEFIEAANPKIFIPLILIGAFLTGLPWIAMIRKTFAQFEVPEPLWLEKVLLFGAFTGPAILSYTVILGLLMEVEGRHKGELLVAGQSWLIIFSVLLGYGVVAGGWWLLEKRLRRRSVASSAPLESVASRASLG